VSLVTDQELIGGPLVLRHASKRSSETWGPDDYDVIQNGRGIGRIFKPRAGVYYVSHAILQKRKAEAGSITRVPAPDLEKLVLDRLRKQLASMGETEDPTAIDDRDLIERHVERVIVKPQAVELRLANEAPAETELLSINETAARQLPPVITLAWSCGSFAAVKGIVHAPSSKPAIKPESRDAVLAAISKARAWIEDIRLGRIACLADIAEREGQCERHIRLLAPLAFVSPRIVTAIVDGTAPADLTVSGLAKALPYSWAEQEHRIGLALSRSLTDPDCFPSS